MEVCKEEEVAAEEEEEVGRKEVLVNTHFFFGDDDEEVKEEKRFPWPERTSSRREKLRLAKIGNETMTKMGKLWKPKELEFGG